MSQLLLGFDIGGSSVKAGVVDPATGEVQGETLSAPTPAASTPRNVVDVIAGLAARLPHVTGPAGVTYPGVVRRGVVRTAANVDHGWIGADGAGLVSQALGRPAVFLNDGDAAGLAEVRLGAGKGVKGPVIMLTFGTGIGSALFIDGILYPNTEFGHMEVGGEEGEHFASARVRTQLGLDWPQWIERVNRYLARVQALFWPDLIIIGGAVSERFAEYAPLLKVEAEVRPAQFANHAGIIGAALAAAEQAALAG